MSFGADYYERGVETGQSLYTNYRWVPEITLPLAHHLITQLNMHEGQRILDFGCAKGYLVKALRMLGMEAYGCDVSTYAISQAPKEVEDVVWVGGADGMGKYNWIIAKDVLEHIPYEKIDDVLRELWVAAKGSVFAVVPLGEKGEYVIPTMERDITHIIREPLEWWEWKFTLAGFHTIATHTFPHIKDHYAAYPKGHGYIRAHREW